MYGAMGPAPRLTAPTDQWETTAPGTDQWEAGVREVAEPSGIRKMCVAVAGIWRLCNKWGILDKIQAYCSYGMSRDTFDGIQLRLDTVQI